MGMLGGQTVLTLLRAYNAASWTGPLLQEDALSASDLLPPQAPSPKSKSKSTFFRHWSEALEKSCLPWSPGTRYGEGRMLLPFLVGAGLLGEWNGSTSYRETHSI